MKNTTSLKPQTAQVGQTAQQLGAAKASAEPGAVTTIFPAGRMLLLLVPYVVVLFLGTI